MRSSEVRDLPGWGRNIAITGLTAAGKTTHAKLLALDLGYEYVSASDLILSLSGFSSAIGESPWTRPDVYDALQSMRQGDDLDNALEVELLSKAASVTHTVFDSWALPWIYQGDLIRVYLRSDRLSRVLKCLVSDRAKRLSLRQAVSLVDRKDLDTRAIFLRRHKFDLFRDTGHFDVILENTGYIAEATVNATKRGVAAFHPIMREAIYSILAGAEVEAESADEFGTPIVISNGSRI